MTTYKTFIRSARSFEEFASAKKALTYEGGMTIEEARAACKEFNDNRTEAEIDRGTKKEFEEE